MPGFVVDSVPSCLFKAFSEEWHRQAFLNGTVRLKHIQQFRKSADAREDSTEGQSYIRVPGRIPVARIDSATLEISRVEHIDGHFNRQSEFLNPTYLHCTSGPDVDLTKLAESFGRSLVRITEPEAFLHRLFESAVASGIGDRTVDFLDAFPVAYTKGSILEEPADLTESLRLDYGQKPADYRWESEYRAVLAFSGPLHSYPDCLVLELGDLSDIASEV